MNSVIENTSIFTSLNIKVFPLIYNTKDGQILKSWPNEASNDTEQIKSWFLDTNYNYGVCTGDGTIVIDVDKKHSNKGIDWLKNNITNLPETLTVQTPSGGYHLYYHVHGTFNNRVRIVEEVDIRGDGGYAVGPGSSIDGKYYAIVKNAPIADANNFIYDFLTKNKSETKNDLYGNSIIIREGERNDTLFKLACSLQSKGLSDIAIHEVLFIENKSKCVPPLSSDEVNRIIKSALRYQKGEAVNHSIVAPQNTPIRYTTKDLLSQKFEKQPFIVSEMISVGATLFAAPPKAGKTFLGLQLADSISEGKDFLGRRVEKGAVLYLAFEDHIAMLQERLKRMNIHPKENFVIDVVEANPEYNLEERIINELEHNNDLKLVIVDTFAKIRGIGNDYDYHNEYNEMSKYHDLGYKYGLSIMLVTHLKKEIIPSDPFIAVYGSRGLQAGAGNILVMYKKNHLSKYRELAIQGKDIPDARITIYQNDDLTFDVSMENEDIEPLEDNISRVINFVIRHKTYEGTHDSLSSELNLNLSGRSLQSLLKKSKKLLLASYIKYETLPRTKNSRPMRLTYYGDDELKSDDSHDGGDSQ